MSSEQPALPNGWVWARIGQIGEIVTGSTPQKKAPAFFGGNIPFYKPTDLDVGYEVVDSREYLSELGASQSRLLPALSVLVTSIGATIGKTGLARKQCATNQQINAVILPEHYISPHWFFWTISSPKGQQMIIENASATTLPIINKSRFSELTLPVPPLNEQRRIVAKIEALKARSQQVKEALEAIPPLLDQFRQSVLAAAFRGDLTADWRSQNPDVKPASVLLESIRAERRRRWEKAALDKMKVNDKTPTDNKWKLKYEEPELIDTVNLPELPLGWCWGKFETVATIASNLVQPNDYLTHPHIAPDNVEKGSGRLLEYKTIKEDGVTSPKHLFFPGQIIYSKIRPYLSKCVLVDFEGLCSADMYPIDSHICYEYLFYYILSNTFINLIQKESGSRVVLPKANQQQVYAIAVPVPPLDEQIVIAGKINELLAYKDSIEVTVKNQLEEIEKLQQSILAKAFRGELVPQDPNDEPAFVLLERIQAEREKRESEAKAAKKSTGNPTGQRSRKAKQQNLESIQLGLPGLE